MQSTRGFTPSTSKIANQIRADNDKDRMINALQREIAIKKSLINDYHAKLTKAQNELHQFQKANKTLNNLYNSYPLLLKLFSSLNINEDSNDKSKNGNRFDEELIPILVLLSMSGEYYTEILHKYFGFPSSRTCRNLKRRFRLKYDITDDILDGSLDSISKLIDLFWKSEDKRCVIAVDAASVNAKLAVHSDGEVEGLTEEMKIDLDLVDLISENLEALYSFYELHHDEIARYFFVFYVCSLDKNNRSFPILIKKHTNGAANLKICDELDDIVDRCKQVGLDVIGISFDGDPSYLNYVEKMCTEFDKLNQLDLNSPLSSIFKEYTGTLIYEDLMHLVKCDRYRLTCGSDICPSLSKDEATFNVNDFKDIGVKDHVLDASRAKKMDDHLPLQLFSQENVQNAILMERYDLLLALLPSYLLINAVMESDLTREQRIERITFGFSIVCTYYNDYLKYDFEKGKQRRNRLGGQNKWMTLYDIIWMKKYMTLAISLTKVLIDPRSVHLGALGTHFLEHFFGMVRRFCHGDDSASSFENTVENIIVLKLLQIENIKEASIQPSRSDSGCVLKEEHEEIKQIPLNICMWLAAELFIQFGSLLNEDLSKAVNDSMELMEDKPKIDVIQFISNTFVKKKNIFRSSSTLRYNTTSGYTSLKRIMSGNSI